MTSRTKPLFLSLVLVQALHSLEEYIGELWEHFPPAAFVCSLVSADLETGFLVINIGLSATPFGRWWNGDIRRACSRRRCC